MRVKGDDSIIMIPRREQHCRVLSSVRGPLHVVQWRVLDEEVKVRGLIGTTVVRDPSMANGESEGGQGRGRVSGRSGLIKVLAVSLVEPHHIHDPHLAEDASVEVGALVGTSSHQETPIGPSLDSES